MFEKTTDSNPEDMSVFSTIYLSMHLHISNFIINNSLLTNVNIVISHVYLH